MMDESKPESRSAQHDDVASRKADSSGDSAPLAAKTKEIPPVSRKASSGGCSATKPAKFEDFESFVRQVYKRKGQPTKLAKKDATHLAECEMPDDAFFDQTLRELAGSDRLLAVPAQMLFAGLPHRQILPLWRKIERVYFATLQMHPASAGLLHLLQEARSSNAPAWPALDQACDSAYFTSLPVVDTDRRLTKADLKKLQHNVISNVVLWLTQFASADLPAVIRELHSNQWSESADRVPKILDRLKLLLKLTDHAATGLVAEAFVAEAEQHRRAAEEAVDREAEATTRFVSLESENESLNGRIEELSARIMALEGEAKASEERHQADLAHASDELERVRSRIVRRIEDELDLLEEGLSALRRDPPKTHVMADHAERAISGLRTELKSLSSGSNT